MDVDILTSYYKGGHRLRQVNYMGNVLPQVSESLTVLKTGTPISNPETIH